MVAAPQPSNRFELCYMIFAGWWKTEKARRWTGGPGGEAAYACFPLHSGCKVARLELAPHQAKAEDFFKGHAMKKIAVEKTGSPAWIRYLIQDDQGGYWTGNKWCKDRCSALLFCDWNEAAHAYRLLEEGQWSGVPSRDFEGVITLRVWSTTGFTAEQLQDYMHRAVNILLDHETHGSGPVPESLVRIDVDWSRLKEALPGDQR